MVQETVLVIEDRIHIGDTTILFTEQDFTDSVQDGQTVVLGGLHKQDISQEVSKVPLLGDIPIIGVLFRFEGEKFVHSELVVFVTQRIIISSEMTATERKQYEATNIGSPEIPPTKKDTWAK